MESVLGRYRNLVILMGVLFLQVLGLAMQVKRGANEASDTRLIRIWAVGLLSPFERGLVWVEDSTGNIWHNYFYLRGVRAENRELKAQIEQMRLEQVRLTEDAAQAHRLQGLLAFKEQYVAKTVAAQVIGSSGSDSSRLVYIDKGSNSGLQRDMAVITADGIVGKVLMVYPSVSQVLLISDQSSGVGAILEKSRLQGVLRGTANGEIVLERVMSDEQVAPGETLRTSGGDQIFPKGLPVGTVTRVGAGKDLFLNIKIKPAANLSKLEEVLVLVEKQEKEPAAEAAVRVRAADILAQRLPSVPEKPADAAAGTTKAAVPSATAKPKAAGTPAVQGLKGAPTNALQSATTGLQGSKVVKPVSSPPKQKVSVAPSGESNPEGSQTAPSITEQKPANSPSIQPVPPADDSSPH